MGLIGPQVQVTPCWSGNLPSVHTRFSTGPRGLTWTSYCPERSGPKRFWFRTTRSAGSWAGTCCRKCPQEDPRLIHILDTSTSRDGFRSRDVFLEDSGHALSKTEPDRTINLCPPQNCSDLSALLRRWNQKNWVRVDNREGLGWFGGSEVNDTAVCLLSVLRTNQVLILVQSLQ